MWVKSWKKMIYPDHLFNFNSDLLVQPNITNYHQKEMFHTQTQTGNTAVSLSSSGGRQQVKFRPNVYVGQTAISSFHLQHVSVRPVFVSIKHSGCVVFSCQHTANMSLLQVTHRMFQNPFIFIYNPHLKASMAVCFYIFKCCFVPVLNTIPLHLTKKSTLLTVPYR